MANANHLLSFRFLIVTGWALATAGLCTDVGRGARVGYIAASSCGSIQVASPPLGIGELGQGIRRGAGIRVRVQALAAFSAHAPPLAEK
jgi:hypothetical protein